MSDLLAAATAALHVSFPTSPGGHQSLSALVVGSPFGPQMAVYVCECLEMFTGQGPDVGTALAGVQAGYLAHLPAPAPAPSS